MLAAAVPKLSPDDLQRVLIPAGIEVSAPWAGVRQHTLDELERSLKAFAQVYAAREDLRGFCRRVVIRAKDRAKLAARNARLSEDKRLLKAEMAEWMLVWLGDPAMFEAWRELRVRRISA